MNPLETLTSLLGLKLTIILHFQKPDEILGNRDDALFIERLKKANTGITSVVIGFDGGHNSMHRTLWNTLRSLSEQKNHLEQKISREKLIGLHVTLLTAQILSLLNQHGRLTISKLVNMTAANRNTLKKHLIHMVQSGHSAKHGKGRGTWYTLT